MTSPADNTTSVKPAVESEAQETLESQFLAARAKITMPKAKGLRPSHLASLRKKTREGRAILADAAKLAKSANAAAVNLGETDEAGGEQISSQQITGC